MIVGVNEKLERLVHEYRQGREKRVFNDAMDCVVESVAVGDCWYVSAEVLGEGMNETDIGEGRELGDLPLFKKCLTNRDGEDFFSAFTSEEELRCEGKNSTAITVKYSAEALFRDLLETEECAGIVINPWTDDFVIEKDNAERVLKLAEEMPEGRIRSLQTVRLDPLAVIDTNEILREWNTGWTDSTGKEERWGLACYPVTADGRVLTVFEKQERLSGRGQTLTEFRVLEYAIADGKAEQLNGYRFKGQDMHVGSVSVVNGVLRAAVTYGDSEDWSVLQLVPDEEEAQFTLYRYVEDAVWDSEGRLAVAYTRNLFDRARWPLVGYNADGEILWHYHHATALACRCVNLDSREDVWFSVAPSTTLEHLDREENRIDSRMVMLPGFDAFALSSDRTKLFAHFSEKDGGSVQYVMSADEEGDYLYPVRFDFRPEDTDGNVLEAKDCKIFGRMSSCKSKVVLNADGRLYVYDIDDCCA